MTWPNRFAFLILCLVTWTITFSQTLPGEPTIGDVMRGQLAGVIDAQQRLAAERGRAKVEYDAARERFFTTDPKSPAHKQAEQKFAQLLQDKDYIYLGIVLNVGVDDGLARARGLGIISGGGDLLDNGIPKLALPAFATWANGVRTSLGAKSENQLLFVTDEAQLQKALLDNEPAYRRYKKDRDRSEFQMWAVAHPREDQINGHVPLFKSVILRTSDAAAMSAYPQALDGRVRQIVLAAENPQRIIACTYGPGLTSDGEDSFVNYLFWHPLAPANIKELLSMDEVNALQFLGDIGVAACPKTDGEALATRQAAMKASEAPQYVEMRRAAAARKAQASRDFFAKGEAIMARCEKLGWTISKTGTETSSDMSYRLRARAFILACAQDDRNADETATSLTVDASRWCELYKANVDSFEASGSGALVNAKRTEAIDDAKRNYESYCRASGDIMTGKAFPAQNDTATTAARASNASSAKTSAPPAATQPQAPPSDDPKVRLCVARKQNLEELKAKASGFRDRMMLSSMEVAFKRDCGALLSKQ